MSRSLPCSALEPALHAYADRELCEAEAARLEAHLEQCAGCAAALREVEAVGAVLKQWERQQAPAAPAHLARNVLARVRDEQAATPPQVQRPALRAPRAGLRTGLRWAAAALLLLGVGALLAHWAGRPQPEPVPFQPRVAQVPEPAAPAPAPPAPGVQPLPRDLLARAPLRALELPSGPEGLPEGVSREAFLAGALDAQRTLEMEVEFERRVGVRGVWIVDVQDGVERRLLVTPGAAEAFAPEDLVAWLRARAAETASAAPQPATRATGPVPARALAARLAAVAAGAPVFQLGREGSAQGVLLRVRAVPRGAARGREALDPLAAVRDGVLRLEPDEALEGPPCVVALVRGAAQPLWLPAGQLLATPSGDVLLAQACWLPAGTGETRWRLACVQVSEGVRRAGPVRLLPFVAPPALRRALLEEEPARAVREVLAGWRLGGAAMAGLPGGWSLLELYDEAAEQARVQDLARV
ncbi:MAG: zf-HC2 domain-containing protein, partial [Planctomycetia bacterium]